MRKLPEVQMSGRETRAGRLFVGGAGEHLHDFVNLFAGCPGKLSDDFVHLFAGGPSELSDDCVNLFASVPPMIVLIRAR